MGSHMQVLLPTRLCLNTPTKIFFFQFKKRSCKRKMNGVILTFTILTVAVFSSPIDQPVSRWKRQLFGTGVAGGRPLTGSSSVVGITNRANNQPRQYGLPYGKPDCGFTYQQRYLNRRWRTVRFQNCHTECICRSYGRFG